jgi:hypothetical protein
MDQSTCVNCGKGEDKAEHCISGGEFLYEDEGEWACSMECLAEIEQGRKDT